MEKQYNNIIMPETRGIVDFQNVPYLKNPPEVIDISVGRQLFVDDFLIEETDLTAEYHKVKKFDGNPILRPETPWETDGAPVACPKSGGVWYDEEDKKFKMWYEATWLKNMCYAESVDGINWMRPKLDDAQTNIILKYDGFVSMNGNGTLTTRKMTFNVKELFFINAVGNVSVEIISANGEVIAKSNTFSGDSTKAFLDFGSFDINSLNNMIFRLKFHVSGKLYSFGFADKHGDAGGAHAAGRVDV